MMINIEVSFATPKKQKIIALLVDENMTILNAIQLSGIAAYFPKEISKIDQTTPIGVFGKRVNIETYHLQDKDRIEIYRPLNKTPNQKRLERIK